MSDQEMIDRVAKAISISFREEGYIEGSSDPEEWDEFIRAAKTAIQAMRVPTEKMIIAGCEGNPTIWNDETDYRFSSDVANDVWLSMIDAILK